MQFIIVYYCFLSSTRLTHTTNNAELAEVNLHLVSEMKTVKKAKTVRMIKMKARQLVEVPPPPPQNMF